MLPALVLVSALLAPQETSADVAALEHHVMRQNPRSVAVLQRWLKQYRAGRIDVGNIDKNIANKSLAKKAGLVPDGTFDAHGTLRENQFCYRDEIELLLGEVAKVNDKKAAQALLSAAAVGLGPGGRCSANMDPWFVRWAAEEQLAKLSSPAARDHLVDAAKGSPAGPKKGRAALQAAALKSLSRFKDATHLPVVQAQLKATEALVRAHAAIALGNLGDAKALAALAGAVATEANELALDRMLFAVRQIWSNVRGAGNRKQLLRCQQAAAKTIGKGSWRADMAKIAFAGFAPSKDVVPPLIDLLARFVEHPEEIAAGTITGLQRTFAYEVLTDITGAFYGIDDLEAWRDYWSRSEGSFRPVDTRKSLAQRKKEFEAAERKRREASGGEKPEGASANPRTRAKTAGMSPGDVFGTPIKGSRVLFVVDCSNTAMDACSLNDPKHLPAALAGKKRVSRLDVIKAEISDAISSLTPDSCFNVVAAAGPRPRLWQKKGPVRATLANKKAARKFLKSLGGEAGQSAWSNPYDSIEAGLGIQDLTWGNAGSHNMDEVFLLTVRLAELGKIQDYVDIELTVVGVSELGKTRFNTVFLGPEDDEDDKSGIGKDLMKRLAQHTGGRFIRP